MSHEKEKWIDETFASLDGMQRAKPPADLFARIESEVGQKRSRVMPMFKWQSAVAAAVLLLVLNVFAIRLYSHRSLSVETEIGVEVAYESQLISDFKLYDE